jgi:hypothetical protein
MSSARVCGGKTATVVLMVGLALIASRVGGTGSANGLDPTLLWQFDAGG